MGKKAVWAVLPNLTPWRGDMRRNPQPYYFGKHHGLSEMAFCQYVKRELVESA